MQQPDKCVHPSVFRLLVQSLTATFNGRPLSTPMAFEIVQVARDDHSVRALLERYKAFRLLSLQIAPEAFGSTYAREVAFSDDVWYSRLANPEVVTFMAFQSSRLVSTITSVGHLAFGPEEMGPSSNPWEASKGGQDASPLHYRINAMFTLPEARGQGIAKALMKKALEYGINEAAELKRPFVGSIAVHVDNVAARSLYEKSGFTTIKEEPLDGSSRMVALLKYSPETIPMNVDK